MWTPNHYPFLGCTLPCVCQWDTTGRQHNKGKTAPSLYSIGLKITDTVTTAYTLLDILVEVTLTFATTALLEPLLVVCLPMRPSFDDRTTPSLVPPSRLCSSPPWY